MLALRTFFSLLLRTALPPTCPPTHHSFFVGQENRNGNGAQEMDRMEQEIERITAEVCQIEEYVEVRRAGTFCLTLRVPMTNQPLCHTLRSPPVHYTLTHAVIAAEVVQRAGLNPCYQGFGGRMAACSAGPTPGLQALVRVAPAALLATVLVESQP